MKKTNVYSVVILVLFQILSISIPAQIIKYPKPWRADNNTAYKFQAFETFVKQQMEKDKIPGLTIGYVKGKETWVGGFGYADIDKKIPAEPDSVYRLASVTKTMTGAAIVQLAEKGKINLDAEIQTYVPYYPKQKWTVTVRQLLVHLGGGQTGSGVGPEYVSPREVVARIAKYPIKIEPGTKFDYQTSGYNLLGAAIEEVTGKSLNDYFRENLWSPLGMKHTQMDNGREEIANRVQGYELKNGELKPAPYMNVSSRFGGGGAVGTVPDMLRWAHNIQRAGVLSIPSLDLMFTPVATKGGRYAGLDDGSWYYTLGWLVFPVNGQFVIYNDGGQIGTNTMVLRIPEQDLTIAFAYNRQDIDRMPYVKRLYEIVTEKLWDIPVYTKNKFDTSAYRGINHAFNYGAMYYDQFNRPSATAPRELAGAFEYFNRNVNRTSLQESFQETFSAINNGRHPVGDTAFIKVGSHMAKELRKKYGKGRANNYSSAGAIPFFADYIAMYKANAKYPAELRFNESFEKLIERWNKDWEKTWNNYTRHFSFTAGSDLNNIEENLSKIFAGAEIYPNLIPQLLELRHSFAAQKDWEKAARAAKIATEYYPESDSTNTYYAISLIILGEKDEARTALKKAANINPNGIASPKTLNQIALALAGIKNEAALYWLKLAVEIYPRETLLFMTIGDFYARQGQRERATESYKKALEIDPNHNQAKEALKKLNN